VNAKLDPAQHAWMTAAETRAVFDALLQDGGAARFVGGAVRNALLGEPAGDVDIATPLVPGVVMARLTAAGLGAVPTGIEHGTVTAVANGKPFEVTTLRRDVETDGRRAVIAFTTDWREDAMRRDFTMNALYADQDGTVYDFFGGVADLRARLVRFVGDAHTRIREDYLRILRLFRFHAWYGAGELDAEALAAAVAEKAGLKKLSGERVQKELLRLLEAKNPLATLTVMHRTGILAEIFPSDVHPDRFERLLSIEAANALSADAALRLSALLPDDMQVLRSIAGQLRLSNALRDRLIQAADVDGRITAALSHSDARKLIYRLGAQCFRDQILRQWANAGAAPNDASWRALLNLRETWKAPVFPLDGNDVMALGLDEGREIGVALRDAENWWVDQDFAPDRFALLERLKQFITKPRV
jgi:poly(A) polymerase